MAQGKIKKTKGPGAKASSNRKQMGTKVFKPKKASLQKQQQVKKKHTSGFMDLTEKSLAGKAGHLEMLRGGKKDSKAENTATKLTQKK
ncbi:hypothetical protein KC357_g3072 [Hortaea werneckii]|nr:hypothetical protein KC357_g3072 [Hortaea werneckii]